MTAISSCRRSLSTAGRGSPWGAASTAPYYGEWVLRQGEVVFGCAPGWLSEDEADARLRAAYAVIKKVSG